MAFRLCRWSDGVMEIVNRLGLLTTMLLEPQQPQIGQRQPDGRQTAPVIRSGRSILFRA
ncbi:hypothetical protein KCP77_13180 [Salmonella enterica subsp. enterica]|nr:hypothetical protein KCP77_13180 [Salmonella enterica subsp. enterica]